MWRNYFKIDGEALRQAQCDNMVLDSPYWKLRNLFDLRKTQLKLGCHTELVEVLLPYKRERSH